MEPCIVRKKTECCGCTACFSVCPRNAISMVCDEEGFLYPQIDSERCIDCYLCRDVCTFQHIHEKNETPLAVYGMKVKDTDERMRSSSGGASHYFTKHVIENGGTVFGAAFDDNFKVIHISVQTLEDGEKIRGSKYVQSELKDTFVHIKNLLAEDRDVLFFGTPCQCNGLVGFLDKENVNTEKLITCDVVCHGVPSPKIWDEYLSMINAEEPICQYLFRDKLSGWHGDNIRVVYSSGKKKINTAKLKIFTQLYFSDYITRACCKECPYTNFHRETDITIGDFWGIEKYHPEFDDNKGVSLILINTAKGQQLFDFIKDSIEYIASTTNECRQEQLLRPYTPAKNRDEFWDEYFKFGFQYVIKKYAGYNKLGITKRYIKNLAKKILHR